MVTAGFGRHQRLLASQQFKAVFEHAPIRVANRHLLLLARPNGLGYSRIGLVVPKKVVRSAVSRNRIKRVARDSFRLWSANPTAVDVVFLARNGLDTLSDKAQTALLRRSWQSIDDKFHRVQRGDR